MPVAADIFPQVQASGGQLALHSTMNIVSNVSTSVLKHLIAIADGSNPLDHEQLTELRAFNSKDPQAVAEALDSMQWSDKVDLHLLLKYMTSSECNIMRPLLGNDLTYPISNYFISSSHNTYLSGNQFYGEASTDAYSNVGELDGS